MKRWRDKGEEKVGEMRFIWLPPGMILGKKENGGGASSDWKVKPRLRGGGGKDKKVGYWNHPHQVAS